ncbi:MAG: biotin synthase BioB [Deltaproteobacteria bacterium]|nr:biotin synthase BioB [Deltaproteobacteria bacterium]
MSTSASWTALAQAAIAGELPSRDQARAVLHAPADELLALLDAAFTVRRHHWGRKVSLHVLENAKLGDCPEDCSFCSQSSVNGSPGGEAPIKSADELVAAARRAFATRAKRYCMVTATRGPSTRDLDVVCEAATRIKAEMDIEICASLGILNEAKAKRLVAAGVDRFNHNLETSERKYAEICTTHTWRDRVETVRIARDAGMTTCCGGIVGLGETEDDLLDLAYALRDLDVDSVPVNFLDPRPGTPLGDRTRIDPQFALRALCMFRFVHPRTDLRVAGGRETTLRSMQVMSLYPANSIFTQGYLTTGGATPFDDHQMIRDAGFELELASGETEAADPAAVASLSPAQPRRLPMAQ